jgi:hypothetical protein
MEAVAWVVSVCAGCLRLSQARMPGILAASAMRCQRSSLANLGRAMVGTAKHQIKQAGVARFCANERIETADAMRGVVRRMLRKRKKRLVVGLDWTDLRGLRTLVASAVFKGRSIPLYRASCTKHVYDGHKSRNGFEESLLLPLRSMVPAGVKAVLPADRSFGRTERARFRQSHGFGHVIRIQPNAHVRSASFTGKLLDYPTHKGICKLLRSVACRSHYAVTQNIVVLRVRGLPEKGQVQLCL